MIPLVHRVKRVLSGSNVDNRTTLVVIMRESKRIHRTKVRKYYET